MTWRNKDFFDPYCYAIRYDEGKIRTLGLIHPLLLPEFAAIYSDFSGVIVNLCAKSSWSLRRPARVATTYFAAEDFIHLEAIGQTTPLSPVEDGGVERDGILQKHSSSFFAYEPYNFLFRFFDSPELLRLEQRFMAYRKIDIAKCFGNIYTHTISWAVKTKAIAKRGKDRQSKKSFDSLCDAAMRRSNDGETHGVLIGSEFSRVFAEIILQDIDVRVEAAALLLKLTDGTEYTVRRYIDDYFIFYNDSRSADLIQTILERELSAHKLYLNESKRADYERPMTTRLSIARAQAKVAISEQLSQGSPVSQSPAKVSSTGMMRQIRAILADCEVKYSQCSSQLLKAIFRSLSREGERARHTTVDETHCFEWLKCAVEVAFFLFSVDTRFQTSIALAKVVNASLRLAKAHEAVHREIADVVIRETVKVLERTVQLRLQCGLEVANLLIALRDIDGIKAIPVSLLEPVWFADWHPTPDCDYFSTISIVFFCGDRPEFGNLLRRCLAHAVARLTNSRGVEILKQTELFCLSLDLLSCPFSFDADRYAIARKLQEALGSPTPQENEIRAMMNEFQGRVFLFDWRSGVETSTYLAKKELSVAY